MSLEEECRKLADDMISDGVNTKLLGGFLEEEGFDVETVKGVLSDKGIRYESEREHKEKEERFHRKIGPYLDIAERYSFLILSVFFLFVLLVTYLFGPGLFKEMSRIIISFLIIKGPKVLIIAFVIKFFVSAYTGILAKGKTNSWKKAFLVSLSFVLLANWLIRGSILWMYFVLPLIVFISINRIYGLKKGTSFLLFFIIIFVHFGYELLLKYVMAL